MKKMCYNSHKTMSNPQDVRPVVCGGLIFFLHERRNFMSFRVITISREFGSGGRTIGKELAEKLGYCYYDSELVSKIAEESGFAQTFIEEHGEDAASPNALLFHLNNWGTSYSDTLYDQLYVYQRNMIMELASKGNCVIVGRCADYILRDYSDCLHIFVHADIEFRKNRIVNQYGEKADSPEKRIKDKDKLRKAFYKYYTNRSWGQAENYHLCIDSGSVGIEKSVAIISQLVNE